jgi:hypothetical protein
MLKGIACPLVFLLTGLLATATPTLAEEGVEEGKVYRILLTNGKEVIGEVVELEDVYKVKMASGTIVQTIQKSQVRELIPLEEKGSAPEKGSLRRSAADITDAEIEEILGSESVEDLYVWDYIEQIDLMDPLDLDEESVQEMLRFAGKNAKTLETPHFVFVYTSDRAAALRLAQRLETVYRWNVTFMNMFDIPPTRPEKKFEVYYFNTFEEFLGYQTLCGFMTGGALGFYMRTNNRCAFFDMNTYPPIAQNLERSKDKNLPLQERRRLKNEYQRWANWMNLGVVQHESTHAIQFNIGIFPKEADTGKWMTEGLCVQFEVPPSVAGGSLGSINYSRLNDFHKMYGPKGERVPWEFVKRMILSDAMGYHDYVMGWAINYYLRKEHKDEYGEWMRLLAAREDDWTIRIDPTQRLADFENIFGKVDEEWVKAMFDFIGSIPMRSEAIIDYPEEARRP